MGRADFHHEFAFITLGDSFILLWNVNFVLAFNDLKFCFWPLMIC